MAVITGTWWPADRAEATYRYLPVEVVAGQRALHVELRYDRGAGVLDLGCFDPHGAFRGWSGGARAQFTVAEDWATPGYLPGPLPDGAWQVALALHRIPPEGLRYELTVADRAPRPEPAADPGPWPQRPARTGPVPPAPPGHRWLAGDLHTHTEHSDGALAVPALA